MENLEIEFGYYDRTEVVYVLLFRGSKNMYINFWNQQEYRDPPTTAGGR